LNQRRRWYGMVALHCICIQHGQTHRLAQAYGSMRDSMAREREGPCGCSCRCSARGPGGVKCEARESCPAAPAGVNAASPDSTTVHGRSSSPCRRTPVAPAAAPGPVRLIDRRRRFLRLHCIGKERKGDDRADTKTEDAVCYASTVMVACVACVIYPFFLADDGNCTHPVSA
jgi:hypothetical protein